MTTLRRALPDSNEALRDAIIGGDVFILPASDVSLDLADRFESRIRAALDYDLPEGPSGLAHIDPHDYFDNDVLGPVRRWSKEGELLDEAFGVVEAFGYLPKEATVHAPLVLHMNPGVGDTPIEETEHFYYPHRRTWYQEPLASAEVWWPMQDVVAGEARRLYPETFGKRIPNNSEDFRYSEWSRFVWYTPHEHPRKFNHRMRDRVLRPTKDVDLGEPLELTCERGEVALFSAAHMQQEPRLPTDRTRFSLEFHVLAIDDIGKEPPGVRDEGRPTKSLAPFRRPFEGF